MVLNFMRQFEISPATKSYFIFYKNRISQPRSPDLCAFLYGRRWQAWSLSLGTRNPARGLNVVPLLCLYYCLHQNDICRTPDMFIKTSLFQCRSSVLESTRKLVLRTARLPLEATRLPSGYYKSIVK